MKTKKKVAKSQSTGRRGKGRPFKKGQSGNPKGMTPRSPEEKALLGIEKWRLETLYTQLAHLTQKELEKIRDSSKTDMKTKIVTKLMLKSGNKSGDGREWERLVSRIFGRPPETVKLGNEGEKPFKLDLSDTRQEAIDALRNVEKRALKEKQQLDKQKKKKNRSELNPA